MRLILKTELGMKAAFFLMTLLIATLFLTVGTASLANAQSDSSTSFAYRADEKGYPVSERVEVEYNDFSAPRLADIFIDGMPHECMLSNFQDQGEERFDSNGDIYWVLTGRGAQTCYYYLRHFSKTKIVMTGGSEESSSNRYRALYMRYNLYNSSFSLTSEAKRWLNLNLMCALNRKESYFFFRTALTLKTKEDRFRCSIH